MSIKLNLSVSVLSHVYLMGVNFLAVPFYISFLGKEAYGMVAVFTLLQVLITVADIGFSATITRQASAFRGNGISVGEYNVFLKLVWIFFFSIALIGSGVMFSGAQFLTNQWLDVESLDIQNVIFSIQLMAVSVGFRWLAGFYRALLVGNEKILWLSSFNSAVATIRYLGVIPVIAMVDEPMTHFFIFQLLVAILEWLIIFLYCRRLVPIPTSEEKNRFNLDPIKKIYKFTIGIAFTGIVWIVITQLDKLLISKLVSLTEFGSFSVAVMAASLVTVLSNPVANVLMPRFAKLYTDGEEDSLIKLYKDSTEVISILVFPLAMMLAMNSHDLLLAWTGEQSIASEGSWVLSLYAAGNGILTVCAFPYYLQFAKGNVRLHVIGNVIFLLLLVPGLIFGIEQYGVVGAGAVWLILNLFILIFWVPVIHRKFLPGKHCGWLFKNVMPMLLVSVIGSIIASDWLEFHGSTFLFFLVCGIAGAIVMFGTALVSELGRQHIFRVKEKLMKKL